MTWNYAYTPNIWPSILMVVLMMALSVFSLRRRSVPGALQLMIACLFAAAWAASLLMNYAAVDTATKLIWLKVQGIVQLPIIIAITCFILEYAWPRRWLTPRNLALLYFPILPSVILLLTNDLHHLVWRSVSMANGALWPQFGLGSWILVFYFFGVMEALILVVFGWLFRRSPQHRWPVALMLAGQIVGRSLFLTNNANPLISVLPLNLMGMSFEFLIYAIVLFGFRIFDPIQLARQTTIQQLHAGMLVLDPGGRIVSLNAAAERILNATARQIKGRPVRELLLAYPEETLAETGDIEIELSLPEAPPLVKTLPEGRLAPAGARPERGHSLGKTQGTARDGEGTAPEGMGTGPELRHYIVAISALNDWHGLEVGRLLLLRDVTERRRAEAQLLEQQRSLATLRERTRLARELHDSLGQILAAAHLQARSARLLLARGEISQTDECLASLAAMTIDAEADVREYLLGLKNFVSTGLPFFPALRQYIAQFSQKYDLLVELCAPAQLEAEHLTPAVELQLRRIIEEALSNVRKHARAKSAQVVFSVSDSMLQITIRDDGQGFDPAAVATPPGEGFGLQTMRERAEALEGCLEVVSQPGQGTQVVAQVPVWERDTLTR